MGARITILAFELDVLIFGLIFFSSSLTQNNLKNCSASNG